MKYSTQKELCEIDGLAPSTHLRLEMASLHPKMLLSFSCGKDSIGAWLAMRDLVEIIPYYCWPIPGLEFIEESLTYYEKFFGCKILRLPHECFFRWLDTMTFTPPEHCSIIEGASFDLFGREKLLSTIRESKKLTEDTPCIVGVRAADSIIRRIHFKRHGAYNKRDGVLYAIWDWRMEKLKDEIKRSGVKLPVDYLLFGRSFDGLDYRFLKQIKEHFPADFQRIMEWFPLAELELKRKEYSERKY